MSTTNGRRYIGDVVFDLLIAVPGFEGEVRKLIAADWKTGTDSFRQYVEPRVVDILGGEGFEGRGGFEAYGDLRYSYLERRIMGRLDPQREPWLWVYAQLVGACIEPGKARTALNAIQGQ